MTTSSKSNGDDAAPAPAPLLFRPQVVSEQQTQWLGAILVKPRLSQRWFAVFAVLVVVLIVTALFLGSYTKKARVSGWLVPEQGMVRVFSPRVGIATRLLVREGDEVGMGQTLLTLSTEHTSTAVGNTQAHIAEALAAQRVSLNAEHERTARLFGLQRATLFERIAAIEAEKKHMQQEIALQEKRVALASESALRLGALQARGFISKQQVQTAAEAELDQAGKLRALERSLLSLGRDRMALEGELKDLPLRLAAQDALVERSIVATTRELAEVEALRELLIAAPQAGTVTAIHIGPGAGVRPGAALLSIVPRGAMLEAHLYASSRAIGFVRARQPVLLRYRAYPYQKFGHYRGTIKSISRTGIEPAELPAQFAAPAPGRAGEALYRITVALSHQAVSAYGKPVPLQPGMQLEADIVLERRRLFEWVLDPVYTLTGRLGDEPRS